MTILDVLKLELENFSDSAMVEPDCELLDGETGFYTVTDSEARKLYSLALASFEAQERSELDMKYAKNADDKADAMLRANQSRSRGQIFIHAFWLRVRELATSSGHPLPVNIIGIKKGWILATAKE